ncbi:DUF961 family protein [Liquorilactobacillus satsumensis]|nr:DUF961 family protein [Liquorilactobacillus satsumensis]
MEINNLLSEKQAELIEVQIPARAGSKTFETDTEVDLLIQDLTHSSWRRW